MKRRPFLYNLTGFAAVCGAGAAGYGLLRTMQPSADVVAKNERTFPIYATAAFKPGQHRIEKEFDRPVLIWRRSPEQIEQALKQDNMADWPDKSLRMAGQPDALPAHDRFRTTNHEWLALWLICPRLGCVPLVGEGEYGGFFCTCGGAHFDMAGRVRKGPAARNMQAIQVGLSADGQNLQLNLQHPPKFG